MVHCCTEFSKLTSPSLQNLTVDSAARFSQNVSTRASSHRDGEVWLKSFDFKSFCALKIISFLDSVSTLLANRSIFPSGSQVVFLVSLFRLRLDKTSGPSRPQCGILLLNNKFRGMSPSGGFASLLFDQGVPKKLLTSASSSRS